MKIWAWSWQTPLFFSSACSAVVSVSLVPGLYSTVSWIAAHQRMHPGEIVVAGHGLGKSSVIGLPALVQRRLAQEEPERAVSRYAGR